MTQNQLGRPSAGGRDDPRRRFLVRSRWLDADWYRQQVEVPAAADPVDHYLQHSAPRGIAPNPLIAELQDPDAYLSADDPRAGLLAPPEMTDPQLALEIELVRALGDFDEEFYRAQLPDPVPPGIDPLAHFCRVGWRLLARPSPDFDVWWYWSNHLDPGREAVNPYVHYLLLGRAAGWAGTPRHRGQRPVQPRRVEGTPRRVCLFAGYDQDGIIDEYVVEYVRELARFADVYYLCDGYLEDGELEKLEGITQGAWAVRHAAYDFGSYSMLARELVTWDVIEQYDELLLVNDSCYLLSDLTAVFRTMDARDCAWWGMQATKGLASTAHTPANSFTEPIPISTVRAEMLERFEDDSVYDFLIGSYFVVYRRDVIDDLHFRRLLDSVHQQRSKLVVILKYEVGLTHYLVGNGLVFDTFVDALYPMHPIYSEWYFDLLAQGMPLLKKYLLYQNHYDVPDLRNWKERITAKFPEAPVEMFERHLYRTSPHDRLTRSFAITTDDAGHVIAPEPIRGAAFRRADRASPTFEHWWAFIVSADQQHLLPDNSRAIFEVVRDDPSVKKIILTRSHRVDLEGENVVVLPLDSPQGEHHLLRAGQIFVDHRPWTTLGKRSFAEEAAHNIVIVRGGNMLQRTGTAERIAPRPTRNKLSTLARALITSSDVDQLAALTAHYPVPYGDCWRTGLPATDFLLMDSSELPDDLRREEAHVRELLEGRRLVLFAPQMRRSTEASAYRFTRDELGALSDWARENDVVLGLREHAYDLERAYLRLLRPLFLDLSAARVPHLPVVLRAADALLTDFSGSAVDFMATGRPVISFVHDLDDVADSLYYDLEHVMPGGVCRDFGELLGALGHLFDEPSAHQVQRYERSRRLFFDDLDAGNARRVAHRVRQGYPSRTHA